MLAGLGIYLFVVHMLTAEKPFIPPRIFKDRNFVAGLLMMFAVGMVLLATSALLAPWLQTLGDYPVATAGLVMAPRGIGTMIAMMIAGRARRPRRSAHADGVRRCAADVVAPEPADDLDARCRAAHLMITTLMQGVGVGFVFIPLQVVAFATLPAALRTDGTALLSLFRNVGSAIGISVFETLLSTGARVEHASLAPFSSPYNRALTATPEVARALAPQTAHGAALLNSMIDYQSQVVAYNNDYWLMALLALPILVLLPLMRRPRGTAAAGTHAALD